jgi:hypothetical protein
VIDLRIWRTALLAVPVALVVGMFSLQDVPEPRSSRTAPDAFDGAAAAALAHELATSASDPRPGSDSDEALAELVAGRFAAIGGAEISEQRFDASFEGEGVELRNVIAVLPGQSERQVALIAHRDANPGSGAASSIASTATLLEIASGFAGATHRKTLVFVSTDGGALGAIGARRFARDYSDAGLLDAVVALSQPAAPEPRQPLVVPWAADPENTAIELTQTASAAVSTETGAPAGDEAPLDELFRLALPAGLGEQAPLIGAGLDAVRVSSAGELPLPPQEDGSEDISTETMERFGRATLALLLALDGTTQPLEHGPTSYVGVSGNLLPGWALALLALTLLAPVTLTALEAAGRSASRPEEALRALAWALGRCLPFVATLLLIYVLALIGLLPSAEFPFDPRSDPPGLGAAIALALMLALLCGGLWLVGAARTTPTTAAPAAAPVALAVACGAVLGIWFVNPFLALLLAPGLNLWLLAMQVGPLARPVPAVILVAVGFLPLAAGVADLAGRFDTGLGVGWDLLRMVSGGQIGFGLALLGCLVAGSAIALPAAIGATAPPPAAPGITIRAGAQSRRWSKPFGSSSRPAGSRRDTPSPSRTAPISVSSQPAAATASRASESRSGGNEARSS